ncbi:MAG: hypothetical protein KDA25_04445 [Phycisphaerales bacterium]|nr:hypothetical protein [Phycisphaerales bacterium]
MKKRHHVRRRLRFGGLVLLVIAAVNFLWGAGEALLGDDVDGVWIAATAAAAFAVPGMLLFLIDAPLSRRMVPMPEVQCPRCNYDLAMLKEPVCPECGLVLPDGLVTPSAKASTNQP